MIGPRAGTRVWLAAGITDMRCGIDSLAVKVQTTLAEDPYAGHVFAFRGRRGDLVKLLWSDGDQHYEDGRIIEAACWSHARRKLWDIHERQHKLPGTLAHQGLERIGKIFKVEAEIRGKSVLRRRRVRQLRTRPVLDGLKAWLSETLAQVSAKSPMALAVGYAMSNWSALVRFAGDGRIEAENNAAERALRAVASGRKNFLHLGSDTGGNSAAVIYTLIGTAKLDGINPQRYLHYVLERIADHKINRIDELLPWAVAAQIANNEHDAQDRPLAA